MVFSYKVQENKLISLYLGFEFVFFIKTINQKSEKSE